MITIITTENTKHNFADAERAADCVQSCQWSLDNQKGTVTVNGVVCDSILAAFLEIGKGI